MHHWKTTKHICHLFHNHSGSSSIQTFYRDYCFNLENNVVHNKTEVHRDLVVFSKPHGYYVEEVGFKPSSCQLQNMYYFHYNISVFSQGCRQYIAWAFSSVQLLSCVQLISTPWTATCQASLSITNSWNLLKLMSIELVMPSNHLILCCPLLLLPSIFPSIRVFSHESALHIRWPKYWSFSFNISSSNEYQDWFPLGWTGWISLQSKGLSRVFSNMIVQKHQFFGAQFSL